MPNADAQFKPDLQFFNCGSFATVTPMTAEGEDWLVENVEGAEDDISRPLPIEWRYFEDIVKAARAAGLICEG